MSGNIPGRAKRTARGGRFASSSIPTRTAPRRRPVRRGQIIEPFGVGAIDDFRNDEALMCAGLDAWFRKPPDTLMMIREQRLEARLDCDYFIKPPEYGEAEGAPRYKIPHVRFPLWHYCPACFRMQKTTIFGGQPECTNCPRGGRRRRMIPVRIVAICEVGHIEDFPFQQWIGCSCDESQRELYFKAGRSSASLAGIKIECHACKRMRSLAGAFDEDALPGVPVQCSGAQPWLGKETGERSCGYPLRAVQRGGSNVYFPLVTSSIFIQPAHTEEADAIARELDNPTFYDNLAAVLVDGEPDRSACSFVARMTGVDQQALFDALKARLAGSAAAAVATTEEDFRRQEYEVLSKSGGSPLQDLFVERAEGAAYGWLGEFVEHVGLVRKLRETRVLVGFSRLMPKSDRGDPCVQKLKLDPDIRWLPAIEVRGEGIFVKLREDAIEGWLADREALDRVDSLIADYSSRRRARGLVPRGIDARFIMLHTLAHAIIKELTFNCGYGSSSLRERLYCNFEDVGHPMNGILIYTASGDAEGTLGGLVAQAAPGRFERLVNDSLRRASWCSNDPVCIESPDRGAYSSNLAACHGCVLLPETSCEEGNRLLDRALLVGTIEATKVGFFRHPPFRRGR